MEIPKEEEYLKVVSVVAFFGMARSDDVKKMTFELVKISKDAIDFTFKLGKTDDGDSCLRFKILAVEDPQQVNTIRQIIHTLLTIFRCMILP